MRQANAFHDRLAALKKVHGKKVSSEEAMNERSKVGPKIQPTLRAEIKPILAGDVDVKQRMKEYLLSRPEGKFFEQALTGSFRLAENAHPKSAASGSTSTNWLVLNSGTNGVCEANPQQLTYYIYDTCLVSNGQEYSFKFTADQYQAFYTTFNHSTVCGGTEISSYSLPLGCAQGMDIMLSSAPLSTNPLPPFGSYATYVQYNNGDCSGQALAGSAIANDVCIPKSYGSMRLNFPNITYYADTGCSLFPNTVLENTTCLANPDDDYYEYSNTQLQLLTGQPYTPTSSVSGYLTLSYSIGDTCLESPPEVLGFALNTCQLDQNLQTSYMYTCSDEYAYKYTYQGSQCSANSQTTVERYTLGCEIDYKQTDDDSLTGLYSIYAACSTGSNAVVAGKGTYGVQQFFDVATCSGVPLSYYGIIEDSCVYVGGSVSFKLEYPDITEYANAYCEGEGVITYPLLSGCEQLYDSSQNVTYSYGYDNTMPDGLYGNSVQKIGTPLVFSSSSSSSSSKMGSTAVAGLAVGLGIAVLIAIGATIYAIIQRNSSKKEDELELTKA